MVECLSAGCGLELMLKNFWEGGFETHGLDRLHVKVMGSRLELLGEEQTCLSRRDLPADGYSDKP